MFVFFGVKNGLVACSIVGDIGSGMKRFQHHCCLQFFWGFTMISLFVICLMVMLVVLVVSALVVIVVIVSVVALVVVMVGAVMVVFILLVAWAFAELTRHSSRADTYDGSLFSMKFNCYLWW